MLKISFVIPCYGSEHTIESVVEEIENTMKEHRDYQHEVILVNDCSPDNVWSVIKEMSKKNSQIKGICMAKNFGQHSALMAGYRRATGDIIISLDDDGQTPANESFSLVEQIKNGYDVVYASYENKKHSFFRNIGTKVNNFMCTKLIKKPKNLTITSFFAARKFVIEEVIKYENAYTYVPGLVLRTTKSIGSVPVQHRARSVGESGYSFKSLVALWMNGFTAFSVAPLRVSSYIGVGAAGVGFIYLIYIIIHKILNPDIPAGWSSTIAIILFLGGIILFVLGMIGEYLGRAYISINKSPQYVVREETSEEKHPFE